MPTQKRTSVVPPPRSPHTPSILPIAERLGADERFAGRGVTIAFLDAGFYAHPDLTTPRNRIIAYHDVLAHKVYRNNMPEPDASSWHGMMTSVVCAGNGALSGGLYKGLAHEADIVLVKVGSMSRVRHDDIRIGIQWVIQNHKKFNIRVLNISCGGDYEASYLGDTLSQAAEDAVRAGLVVVVAVGNAGNDPNHVIYPPASVPAVITVGGLDDRGGGGDHVGLYHSSYGPTIDGLQKPEVIAPAIWLAAPILPGTPTAAQAALISALAKAANDDELHGALAEHRGVDEEFDTAAKRDAYHIRNLLEIKRRDQKVISKHYKHVDGTSFSAPIVCSVVAQMLEANSALTPAQVKRILIDTARRLPDVSTDRQGWGVVQPARAVTRALEKRV
ncbi:MAG: S8 family serine peptidase [Deltaproteobacteria bacterium]